MEACLKHLEGFDKSLCDLADSGKDSHRRIDKRAKEVESGGVGESKHPLGGQGEGLRDGNLTPSLSSFLGRFSIQPGSPDVGRIQGIPVDSSPGEEG